jgi:GST-like protein
MIDVYTWPTPNGQKVHIMLEECGLPYAVHAVDIGAGEQFTPAFLEISPNNRIPAIVDPDGPDGEPISLFESGAILVYLAGKTGRFMPKSTRGRYKVLEWVMWQMGGVGPMFGQANHFVRYAPEKLPYAIERYTNEVKRLARVLDKQLGRTGEYAAGPEYSIADIAIFPWIRSARNSSLLDLDETPNLARWFKAIEARPAVRKGLDVLADRRRPLLDDKARSALFGKQQFAKR